MATQTGVLLLSALRSSTSRGVLREVSENLFTEDDEKAAFRFLRDFVASHGAFPSVSVFRRETGIGPVITTNPLSYYVDQSRQQVLYETLLEPYGRLRTAMENARPDEVITIAQEMKGLSARLSSQSADFMPLDNIIDLVETDYNEAATNSGLRGIPTGWHVVDEQTGGWQPEDLISLVGRPGRGKSWVQIFHAYSAWVAGYNVLYISNELGAVQLGRRIVGLHTRVNPRLIQKGRISTFAQSQFLDSLSGMHNGFPFNVVVGGFRKSVETVAAVAEATEPDIIFVDAGYLMSPMTKRRSSDSRRETVSDTIEDLKRLNLDLRRPIHITLQFNRRAERSADRPMRGAAQGDDQRQRNPIAHLDLSKIGESDVPSQASSVVMGLENCPPPYIKTRKYLGFLKGREGEQGCMVINYQHQPMDFSVVQENAQNDNGTAALPDMSYME